MSRTLSIFERISQNRWLSHSLFWTLTLVASTLLVGQWHENYAEAFMQNLILLPPKVIAAYTLLYFQIYTLIFKRRYISFIFTFLLSAYLCSALGRILMVHGYERFFREGTFYMEPLTEIMSDIPVLFQKYLLFIYMFPMMFVILKLMKDQVSTRQNQEILKKEKAVAELQFLKAQIHPHFLFNTLNNLYALTLQKSDKAPEMLLKLSDILDYILYQGNAPLISLEKEIELIENYLDLELLRYGDRLTLKFKHNIDDLQTRVAPLILLPLIENAFKHGASGAIKAPEIQISLRVSNQVLHLDIFNTKSLSPSNGSSTDKHGIGTVNIRKQLAITYPKAHEIEVVETPEAYAVTLQIDLRKYQS